ncbi:MAG TPA: ABC transporter permease, partial [Roseivirga sp.]
MNKIFLVLKREYLTRVKKKSFLLATLLTPLVLPAIIFTIAYFATRDKDSRHEEILVLDQSGYFGEVFTANGYDFKYVTGEVETLKKSFKEDGAFGLLLIPEVDLSDLSVRRFDGFELYSETNPSVGVVGRIEELIESRLGDLKLQRSGLDQKLISDLQVNASLSSFTISEDGEAKESNSKLSFAIGYGTGFLIYMFIFVYGSQIMQSVLDEKTSRIVEVIVSSVRPFQLMMGKVLGVGAVGFTQLLIWIVLITTLSTVGLSIFASGGNEMMMEAASQQMPQEALTQQQEMAANIQNMIASVPVTKILICFLFYFLGAYFLYGALYAAVGSAVDSLQDAQQFMFPIVIPIIASIMAMFFVLD